MRGCTCTHTAKHHKQSGRCRKGCTCPAALLKVQRKQRAHDDAIARLPKGRIKAAHSGSGATR